MPTDPLYIAPRVEPIQLAPGQSQLGIAMPFQIATIGINNYSEFFAFIEPQSRPGFWVSPYQTGMYVPLYPSSNSINVTQSRIGPSGTSGVISNFGAGSLDLWLYDAPLPPDPGIISGPDALFEETFALLDVVANFGGSVTVLVAGPTENLIITRLAISPNSFTSGSFLFSGVDINWQELPPPLPPFQPFSWDQAISQESPYTSDVYDRGTAVIHANDTLQISGSYENFGHYTAGGITTIVTGMVQFYRVNA